MTGLAIPVTAHDHAQGSAQAPAVLVEYGDYECPHCRYAHPIVRRVRQHFGARLRFVFRNFPLREMHRFAETAAETAEYAAAHDRFWEMHDAIFEHQDSLGLPLLHQLTEGLGLSVRDLDDALRRSTYAERVREDFLGGVRSGVNGTPTFFVNGRRHDGPFEFDELVAAIELSLR